MNEIKVDIILQGLIALIPIVSAEGHMEMQALLVNGEHAIAEQRSAYAKSEEYGSCMNRHVAEIEISGIVAASKQNCAEENRCKPEGPFCICELHGREIVLEPKRETPGPKMAIDRVPRRALPFSKSIGDEESLAYIPSLSALGAELNLDYLRETEPEVVSSRFRFPFDEVRACDYAWRREGLADHVHAFSFRDIGSAEQSHHVLQAGAQSVRVSVSLPSAADAAVVLRNLDGSGPVRFNLESKGDKRATLRVMNYRMREDCTGEDCPEKERMAIANPCNDGIGRDFALFYQLAKNPPDVDERPVPHIRHSLWTDFASVTPKKCMPEDRAATSIPICFMTRFDAVREEDVPQ